MLPSLLSHHISQGLETFLRSTFSLAKGPFADMLERFLAERKAIKGPWVSLGLPFMVGDGKKSWFPELGLGFVPYRHQEIAFERLWQPDGHPKSTIVATGTGSGKTECFLYPILAHCLRAKEQGEAGIKAILIYPMNALATDQARRIASLVHGSERLKQAGIRAGLYVGGMEAGSQGTTTMQADSIITSRDVLRDNPPDILLTNYKMLDLLLQRQEDIALWAKNDNDTLRYLVVDELHTFDGAQGTDLACLVRRLKIRLRTRQGQLACVGTSATLGSGENAQAELLAYASRLFGEDFEADAVIGEQRVQPAQFLGDGIIDHTSPPDAASLPELELKPGDTQTSYLERQYALWFEESADRLGPDIMADEARILLGDKLKRHLFFQNLVRKLKDDIAVVDKLAEGFFDKHLMAVDGYAQNAIESLLALAAHARSASSGRTSPLLQQREQIWLREMTGMIATLAAEPQLHFQADLSRDKAEQCLPVIFCRECGTAGWITHVRAGKEAFETGTERIYQSFFGKDRDFTIFLPKGTLRQPEHKGSDKRRQVNVCPKCHRFMPVKTEGVCPVCGEGRLVTVEMLDNHEHGSCPICDAKNSWLILGSRAASLTSSAIATIMSSNVNDDKKVLTFSDSVQDASHRAGFFGARSYDMALRMAMQQCVDAQETPIRLTEFPEAFARFWGNRLDPADYVATFIPPSLEWLYPYDMMRKTGQADDELKETVDKRLKWEFWAAFTFRSGIGRTLERSACSVTFVPTDVLNPLAVKLHTLLTGQFDKLRHVPLERVEQFLLGFVRHMRAQGAVFLNDLQRGWVHLAHSPFAMSKTRYWLPTLSKRQKLPSFLTADYREGHEAIYQSNGKTWCLDWIYRNFVDIFTMGHMDALGVYNSLLRLMEEAGLARSEDLARDKNPVAAWGLNGEQVFLSGSVGEMACDTCGRTITIHADQGGLWEGAHCLMIGCPGHYEQADKPVAFHADIFRHGALERIVTAEHTGLLKREEREATEASFMRKKEQGRKAWDYNLLSCTPTLEMGINIGDLSTTVQCSVPPSQANYLQRIGRAGRTDGNAVNVTIAGARAHDLFFYEQPLEMMRGAVASPGLFLNATAVLERQLTAYCLDCWVVEPNRKAADFAPDVSTMYKAAADVKKGGAKRDAALLGSFPYNFLTYIGQHASQRFDEFVALFPEMHEDVKAYLHNFLMGNGKDQTPLDYKISQILETALKEDDSLRERIRKLRKTHEEIKKRPQDETTADALEKIRREIAAFSHLHKDLRERKPAQFFADEGLLPNYAFPEQGVSLHSVIYRQKTGSAEYDTQTFTYQRSASSALRELAPGCSFYAGKRKVTVQKVDVKTAQLAPWRVCPECTHMEREQTGNLNGAHCPKCGSVHFGDSGQILSMLRTTQVFSNTADRDSRIDDSSENREYTFFTTWLLLEYENGAGEDAWKLDTDETVFAFSYIPRASFREINFGESDEKTPIQIGGRKLQNRGFRICADCGNVLPKNAEPKDHDWGCPARTQGAKPNVHECLYLYREFESEALKILLPFTSLVNESSLESFVAAFNMGLRLRFGGSLQHLQTTLHHEPDPENHNLSKQFLVVYDSVPGGTGYLKDLIHEGRLFEVLELALATLDACSCDTDGCYSCLRAYRNSSKSTKISKQVARDLLRPLLRYKDKLEKTKDFDDISVSPLFESELEKNFIEALRRSKFNGNRVHVAPHIVNGRPGFALEINGRHWSIEQQVEIGARDGVAVDARCDFVFSPVHQPMQVKPVIVSTDGFEWHKDRLAHDFVQRMAQVKSGKYVSWSLTWNDVASVLNQGVDNNWQEIVDEQWSDLAEGLFREKELNREHRVAERSAFELLLGYLANPDEQQWQTIATVYGVLASLLTDLDVYRGKARALPAPLADFAEHGNIQRGGHSTYDHIQRFANVGLDAQGAPEVGLVLLLQDTDEDRTNLHFQKAWHSCLRAMNIYQFLPDFVAATKSCTDAELATICRKMATPLARYEGDWDKVGELAVPEAESVLQSLCRAGCPLPTVGLDVEIDKKVVAMLELAWEEKKIGVYTSDMAEGTQTVIQAGWTLFNLDELVNDASPLLRALGA